MRERRDTYRILDNIKADLRQVVRMVVMVCWQTNRTNVPPGGLLVSLPMHKPGPRYKLLLAPCLLVAGILTYHL